MKWIKKNWIWVLIVALIATSFGIYNAKQADASTLPHGVTQKCGIHYDYGIYPYIKCYAIIQPGTTAEENVLIQRYRADGTTTFVFAVGLACAGITGPLAPVCALVAGAYATQIGNAYQDAARAHRCVRFRYESSHPSGPGLNFHVEPYGAQQNWYLQWSSYWNAYIWVWKNPDQCKTRTPKTPVPPIPSNPWNNLGFF